MIIRKQRRLVVRMGQYESHEVVSEVTVDTNNEDDRLLVGSEEPIPSTDEVAEFLDDTLQVLMASDVEEAAFNTADEDSFIHEYHKNNKRK